MGAKDIYTDLAKKILLHLMVTQDEETIEGILHDRNSYKIFGKDWRRVNLDEFIDKFTITADDYNMSTNTRKISFWNDGKEYEIVCAVGASYFRVQRQPYIDSKGILHGAEYVDIDLKPPKIPGGLRGDPAKDLFNKLTHFAMTHKKGTV